jgi:hypothetical protein
MIQCAASQLFSRYEEQAGTLYQAEFYKTVGLVLLSCWVAYRIHSGKFSAAWFGFQLFATAFFFSPKIFVALLAWVYFVYLTYKTALSSSALVGSKAVEQVEENLLS